MIDTGELKKGVVIVLDGKLQQIIGFQHIKMKHTGLTRMKLRDIASGHNTERTFPSDEKFETAALDEDYVQYLYSDSGQYYFMDEKTFEQTAITQERLGDTAGFLNEGARVKLESYKGELISVELPASVNLKVTYTEPGFRGDTAQGGTKPATLETGISVQVPLFIDAGDVIKVDTRSGDYLGKAAD